ncbi:tyrosine-type recombinase/integrase [Clostridium perfringens]|uniref:tyrosine-type recombinase/integrase n=1 Tax=Clostridium perfringens TaxID=1502 RepID=UPI001ABB53C5|nr:tyrosine-type recombinase/integrase [Clostridium perfringens]MBO3414865.1 tyrosine-type recombinase/integrase [Clostridium perfringens]
MRKIKLKREFSKTFESGFDDFIDSCKARNLREGTIKHYKESYKSIIRFIDPEIAINSIDEKVFNEFVKDCRDLNVSSQTVYTYSRDLKTILNFFIRMEYMKSFKIKLPEVDKTPIETYTDAELKILLKKPDLKKCSFSNYQSWVIINFLLSTGVRLNSLVNIKVKDLDFDNQVVHVNVTKNRRPLIIPLNRDMIKILREYLKLRDHESIEDLLFSNVYGRKLCQRTLFGMMQTYHNERGVVKTGIHRFRHTFAKKWITLGGSVVTLQKILGHSSLNITQNYINLLVEDIKRDVDKYNILEEFNKDTHIKIKK